MELDYTKIGERLKYLRGKLSQSLFGENIGYSYSYVKNCEHGKKPSLEYLHKIVQTYGVSINWIIYGIEPIFPNEQSKSCSCETRTNPPLDVATFEDAHGR